MIEHYFDEATGRVIRLGEITQEDAVKRLVMYGVDPSIAQNHVEKSLKKHHLGGLTEEKAKQCLIDNGYNSINILYFLYRRLTIKFSSNCPFESIYFDVDMDGRGAKFYVVTRDSFTQDFLQKLLRPQGQPINPKKSSYHDAVTNLSRIKSDTIYTVQIYFNVTKHDDPKIPQDREQDIIHVLNIIFDKLETLKTRDEKSIYLKDVRLMCIVFAQRYVIDENKDFPNGNAFVCSRVMSFKKDYFEKPMDELEGLSDNNNTETSNSIKQLETLLDAILKNDIDSIKTSLKHVNVNTRHPKTKITPLHQAAIHSHNDVVKEVVTILFAAGANPELKVDGETASEWAKMNDRPDVAALIERARLKRLKDQIQIVLDNSVKQKKLPLNSDKKNIDEREKELLRRILSGESILELLRAGVNPNAKVGGTVPIVYFALPNLREKRRSEDILNNLKFLLQHNVNVINLDYYQTVLAALVFNTFHYDETQNPELHRDTKKILQILPYADNDSTFQYFSEVPDPLSVSAWALRGKWWSMEQPISIPRISYDPPEQNPRSTRITKYTINDQDVVFIETRTFSEKIIKEFFKNNSVMANRLYEIFENAWKEIDKNIPKNELKKSWDEILYDNLKGAVVYIDLVKIDNKIVGFNIAQMFKAKKNNKLVLIHHMKLTVIEKEFREKIKGLIRIVSFERGFERTDIEILTVYESASIPSYLWPFDLKKFNPRDNCNSDWFPLLKETIYANKECMIKPGNYFYIKDELAIFKNKNDSNTPGFFYKKSSIVAELACNHELVFDGYSAIVCFTKRDNAEAFEKMKANDMTAHDTASLASAQIAQSKL